MRPAIAIASTCLWVVPLSLTSPLGHSRSLNGSIGPQVDLGYTGYSGVTNTTTGLNTFKGWQAPKAPVVNRSSIIQASLFGPACPQSLFSLEPLSANPGTLGNEDCLYFNIYAPIHVGGYGAGDGMQDLTAIININNNSFIGVAIQYRLGAFGLLSSDEVHRKGVVNAGLLDQHFALQWVQDHIHSFGGDPTRVTISGESAGAGSVMLHTMAYNGTLGTSLFTYYAFAAQAGCPASTAYGSSSQNIFDCLVAKDTTTLQKASFNVSVSRVYGTWAFIPATDGTFVQQVPSQQLLNIQINGNRTLTRNNALESYLFVPRSITTKSALLKWTHLLFPLFTDADVAKLLAAYNYTSDPQTIADGIYGEMTFTCPSYWLVEAYAQEGPTVYGRAGFKYQYCVPAAIHGSDVAGYFGPPYPNQGPDFSSFITGNDPSIPYDPNSGAVRNWPLYTKEIPSMTNLNEAGGVGFNIAIAGASFTEYEEPGLKNDITLVDAYDFGHGRGARCEFWRSISAKVPE
ncbi:alpha/beta-hydrolase [Acephala macrosclerotiorum]|nr:alpha/beta-hydrolase [Acephala macrosclerotiorum]